MKCRLLFLCLFLCGCANVSERNAHVRNPIGVFPLRLGTNLVVAFVNQAETPLFLEVNHKWAEYGIKKHLEDGTVLIMPEFSEDMKTSIPINGWSPVRLLPDEPAIAIAPIETNGCRLCAIDLLWQVFMPIPGKEPTWFPTSKSDFSKTEWDWSFGYGTLSGDVFGSVPLEDRKMKHEAIWRNGVFVGDAIRP